MSGSALDSITLKAQLHVLPKAMAGERARHDAEYLGHVLANLPIVIFAFDNEGLITFMARLSSLTIGEEVERPEHAAAQAMIAQKQALIGNAEAGVLDALSAVAVAAAGVEQRRAQCRPGLARHHVSRRSRWLGVAAVEVERVT